MNIDEMTVTDVEKRLAELPDEIRSATDSEQVNALNSEVDALEQRKAAILAAADEQRAAAEAVANGAGKTITERKEREKMEMRNTPEYLAKLKNAIIKNDYSEMRSLITENASGDVELPDFVAEKVEQAWEDDEVMRRVKRTYVKGNYTVMFEKSASGASVHTEGDVAPAEETLTIGKVQLVPATIKKWLAYSTEVSEMTPRAFIDWLYDEFRYQITETAAAGVIGSILAAAADGGTNLPMVDTTTLTFDATAVVTLEGLLKGAVRPVAIMSRGTEAALKALMISSGTNVGDVFDGLEIVHTSALPNYADASSSDPYMIVGDLNGVTCNFPNGDDVKFIYDETTLAPEDMIRIIGKLLVGMAVTRPYAFAVGTKA